MLVLAIDVAVSGCAVAVLDCGTSVSHVKNMETDRGQAEHLIPLIEEVVRESGHVMQDINIIAVTRGPGSFTGVRIGLSTARTLGLALNIPVFGVSTLDALAKNHENAIKTLFLIDTKRGDYYGQVGLGGQPKIWTEEEVANYQGPIVKDAVPDIACVAHMGADMYVEQVGYDIRNAPSPLYLRDAEVSESKKKPLQIL